MVGRVFSAALDTGIAIVPRSFNDAELTSAFNGTLAAFPATGFAEFSSIAPSAVVFGTSSAILWQGTDGRLNAFVVLPGAVSRICTTWPAQYADADQGESILKPPGASGLQHIPASYSKITVLDGSATVFDGYTDAAGCISAEGGTFPMPSSTWTVRQTTDFRRNSLEVHENARATVVGGR